ncbi:Interleukin-6 [Collichthys lucidus]|uniref:Interleukin-6 n=1 Tax=Collichthys lucidus TaxID=240159 RepID=A0A4U5VJG6_COLLU|nr:Interleukin-6 [Collichthys lucidus]
MPSKLNAYLLSAVMLVALMRRALGAPTALTESPAGDPSGDEAQEEVEGNPSDAVKAWIYAVSTLSRHEQEFEAEFHHFHKYNILDQYTIAWLPKDCPSSYNKEACLQWLAKGLFTYTAVLKYVAKEYPNQRILTVAERDNLIQLIKDKMRHPEHVTALTRGQEEQLLRNIDTPTIYNRKMTAHSILYMFRHFLIGGQRQFRKWEQPRRSLTNKGITPVTYQMLKS